MVFAKTLLPVSSWAECFKLRVSHLSVTSCCTKWCLNRRGGHFKPTHSLYYTNSAQEQSPLATKTSGQMKFIFLRKLKSRKQPSFHSGMKLTDGLFSLVLLQFPSLHLIWIFNQVWIWCFLGLIPLGVNGRISLFLLLETVYVKP